MNNLRAIRKRLGATQEALAREIDCTQANVGHIESGRQILRPELARRVIEYAARLGSKVTFDDLYEEGRFPEEDGHQSTHPEDHPEGATHG